MARYAVLDGEGEADEKGCEGKVVAEMKRYRCGVCGYVYDPEVGDPDSGIDPGTAFEELPDGWVCPWCGSDKTHFYPVD